MPRPLASLLSLALAAVVLAGVVLAGCGGDSAAVPTPRHIMYISSKADERLVTNLVPTHARDFDDVGLFRQMPAQRAALPPSNRIARANGKTLSTLSASEIAARLRAAIDGSCTRTAPCASGLVAIDDIAGEFRGKGGSALLEAMQQLNGEDAARGGSYADRVIMYLDWDMLSELANPRTAPKWSAVVEAIALGNTAWLEMYESTGARQIDVVDLASWRTVPTAAHAALTGAGMDEANLHMIIGPWSGTLPGQQASACNDALECIWHAATLTPVNRSMVRNGVGLYRYGRAQLADFCTFVWQAEPGRAPDPAVRENCAHWVAGELDFLVPGSADRMR